MARTVQKHEDEYLHIPKALIIAIVIVGFGALWMLLGIHVWNTVGLSELAIIYNWFGVFYTGLMFLSLTGIILFFMIILIVTSDD